MTKLDISYEDILHEIRELSVRSPEGFSTADMSATVGRTPAWCRVQIGKLIAAGKARFTGFRTTDRIDGKRTQVPVYVIIGKHT